MDSELLSRFSATVQSIHGAALQPLPWPQAWQQALAHIAALHGAQLALLWTPTTHPDDGGFAVAHAISEAFLQDWAAHHIAHGVWTAQACRLCSGVVFSGQQPGLPLTSRSVFRGSDGAPFTEADRRVHALVTRQLSLALGAALRLRDAEARLATSLQALDCLHGAVLLIGQRGHVLFANRSALALLGQKRGLQLCAGTPATDALGWLQAASASAQAALDAELRAALASDPLRAQHFVHGLALQSPPPAQGPRVLHAVPLAEGSSELWCRLLQPGAIVFITDPQAVPLLDAALLRRLYGISSAECRVAQQLLRGQSLQHTALHLHLSDNTVKTHLRQLFEKTATRRQQQLIRLLLALAAQH